MLMHYVPAVAFSLATLAAPERLVQTPTYEDSCRTNDASRALCDTEARLTDALRHNDTDALDDVYADDFRLINYRGTVLQKAGVLQALRSGTPRFDSLATSELELRIYGDAGVVTGRQRQVAREPGAGEAHPADVRFTHMFVRTNGKWRLVMSQITPLVSTTRP